MKVRRRKGKEVRGYRGTEARRYGDREYEKVMRATYRG